MKIFTNTIFQLRHRISLGRGIINALKLFFNKSAKNIPTYRYWKNLYTHALYSPFSFVSKLFACAYSVFILFPYLFTFYLGLIECWCCFAKIFFLYYVILMSRVMDHRPLLCAKVNECDINEHFLITLWLALLSNRK